MMLQESPPTQAEQTAIDKGISLVVDNYNDHRDVEKNEELVFDDVKVVWFSKVLRNWKGLFITGRQDRLYYEVTYDGARKRAYVDIYTKIGQKVVPEKENI